jgi:hypothetical protein
METAQRIQEGIRKGRVDLIPASTYAKNEHCTVRAIYKRIERGTLRGLKDMTGHVYVQVEPTKPRYWDEGDIKAYISDEKGLKGRCSEGEYEAFKLFIHRVVSYSIVLGRKLQA